MWAMQVVCRHDMCIGVSPLSSPSLPLQEVCRHALCIGAIGEGAFDAMRCTHVGGTRIA